MFGDVGHGFLMALGAFMCIRHELVLKKIKAIPVLMPTPDVYESLSRGIIAAGAGDSVAGGRAP